MFHLSLVEPGGFRTDFAGRSLQQAREPIADYADTAGRRRKEHDTYHGTQPGDPARAAQAIITAVEAKDPPFLLLLGKDACDAFQAVSTRKAKSWRTGGNSVWAPVSPAKPSARTEGYAVCGVCEDRSNWHGAAAQPLPALSIERKGNPPVPAPGPRAPLRPCDVRCRSLGRRRRPPKRARSHGGRRADPRGHRGATRAPASDN